MLLLLPLVGAGLASWSGSGTADYTVVPGDSLWSIATEHGLTVAELAAANGLDPAGILPIGKVLVLPSSGAQTATAASSAGAEGTASADPFDFCATFQPERGPWGELPAGLAGSATYARLHPIFVHWSEHYGVSLALIEAVAWQESGWQQWVVSPTGAVGVGQIEPYTATFIENQLVGQALDLHSESDNIRMTAAFLSFLAHIEGGNTCATVAAYYEGPINLQTLGVLPSARQYVADVEYLQAQFE